MMHLALSHATTLQRLQFDDYPSELKLQLKSLSLVNRTMYLSFSIYKSHTFYLYDLCYQFLHLNQLCDCFQPPVSTHILTALGSTSKLIHLHSHTQTHFKTLQDYII